jgi:hypothetical protein
MARLHGASVGKEATFRQCGSTPEPPAADWSAFASGLSICLRTAQAYGIRQPKGIGVATEEMRSYFVGSTRYRVFSPGDVGPGNQFLTDNEVTLFDFEFSRYRHFALELSNLLAPFPVVSTASAFPDDLGNEMEDLYFREIGGMLAGLPAEERQRARVLGIAWWTFASVGADLTTAFSQDYQWGLTTCRERHLHKLGILARIADEIPGTRPLGILADRLHGLLRNTWIHTGRLPFYPAFRKD